MTLDIKPVPTSLCFGVDLSDPYAGADPELAAALRVFPLLETPTSDNLSTLRAANRNRSISAAPELQPRQAVARGPAGDVPVLIFDPKPHLRDRPATIYIHGGGFIMGRADTTLQRAQDIAQATDGMVVSVDYLLAPEAPFPAALEQNLAVLAWLHENAGRFGVDPTRIAVCGDSAGGGHASMLALAARDRKVAPNAFQCLIYPMLDDRTGSSRPASPHVGRLVWTETANRFGWSALLGKPAGSPSVPAGSVPARVEDLSSLPPTFIGVGAIDLFSEEDIEYAKRLVLAGVPTELFVVPGAYHGFDVVAPDARPSVEFRNACRSALRRGLGIG